MNRDNRVTVVEPTDAADAIIAILGVLAEAVRSDRVLQRKLAEALAPIVSVRSDTTAEPPPRSRWFDR